MSLLDKYYTGEHQIFRESVRRYFEKEVTPHADLWEKEGIVPKDAWKKFGSQGFLCPWLPEEYGGSGADFLYSFILAEELARTHCGGFFFPLHSDIIVPYLFTYGNDEQKQRWLPGCVTGDGITALAMTEPGTGSDLAAIRTTAVKDGDSYVINGQKTFISNGINCDLVIVAARDPEIKQEHQAVDLYLVEAGTPGFEKGKQIKKIGWHGQDTAELYFTDCRIPKENRLGEKGSGFIKLMMKLQQERLICAIGAQAAAEYMLDITIKYCKERTAFGRPISRFQHISFEIVEMATEVRLGRTFLDKLIADHMEGREIVVDVSMAKYWTTDMASRVADRCVQLFGGYGYCAEYPVSRFYTDARIQTIYAGTSEVMKLIVARSMGL